jgi:lipopolysaccharide biosynthesis protein
VLRLPDVAPRTLAFARRVIACPHGPSPDAHAVAPLALPAVSAARIAVVLHLFYPSLWPDFERALLALPEPCDVFVSCRPRAEGAVRRLVSARFPGAVVYASPNLGRDVWPFLRWLATPGIERYAYVLKLHSKKSMHIDDAVRTPMGSGDDWRNRTIAGLVGSRERVSQLLAALDARREVGIVAPSGFLYDQIAWRAATGRTLEMLRRRLAIEQPLGGGFPAGTMFWARVESLLPLARALSSDPSLVDFEREAGQVDGTLHHAYERLFPLVATKQGLRTVEAAELVGV